LLILYFKKETENCVCGGGGGGGGGRKIQIIKIIKFQRQNRRCQFSG